MSPALVVLAAGIGSRYGGLKQIDPVGTDGEFVLDYSVYDAWQAGFGKVVFVIRPELEEPLRDHFAPVGDRLEMACEYQELIDVPAGFTVPPTREKPWGTGHAIRAARNSVHGPFAVINADDFYGRRSFRLLADFLAMLPEGGDQGTAQFCLVAFELRKTLSRHGSVARGVCTVDADSCLAGVCETVGIEDSGDGNGRVRGEDGQWRSLPGTTPVSMNLWGFTPALFDHLDSQFADFLAERGSEPKAEFYIPTVVDRLIAEGKVTANVLHTPEQWLGMTYREDRKAVTDGIAALTDAGVYPHGLWR